MFESVEMFVVEVLKVEEKNLFAVFPIGATIQDGGKRKRSVLSGYLPLIIILGSCQHIHILCNLHRRGLDLIMPAS